jgi:hypothetical protein
MKSRLWKSHPAGEHIHFVKNYVVQPHSYLEHSTHNIPTEPPSPTAFSLTEYMAEKNPASEARNVLKTAGNLPHTLTTFQ